MRQEILLESGTNEVEFLEFLIGGQSYGINIAKIRQILKYEPGQLTPLHNPQPSVMGGYEFQGESVLLVDLARHIGKRRSEAEPRIALVCEFNDTKVAFLVDGVDNIHRVSWGAIQPVSTHAERFGRLIVGVVPLEGVDLLILDYEGVLADVRPATRWGRLETPPTEDALARRAGRRIFFADDSSTFRMGLRENLNLAGYADCVEFENGQAAYDAVMREDRSARAAGGALRDRVRVLVTDVEMPLLDGLALCRRLKAEAPGLPVIILSSLIDEQMALKCQSVEADAFLTKRQPDRLIELLDQLAA